MGAAASGDAGPFEYEDGGDPDSWDCTRCGGEGFQESDDPLWDGQDIIDCKACGGSGRRKDQTVW